MGLKKVYRLKLLISYLLIFAVSVGLVFAPIGVVYASAPHMVIEMYTALYTPDADDKFTHTEEFNAGDTVALVVGAKMSNGVSIEDYYNGGITSGVFSVIVPKNIVDAGLTVMKYDDDLAVDIVESISRDHANDTLLVSAVFSRNNNNIVITNIDGDSPIDILCFVFQVPSGLGAGNYEISLGNTEIVVTEKGATQGTLLGGLEVGGAEQIVIGDQGGGPGGPTPTPMTPMLAAGSIVIHNNQNTIGTTTNSISDKFDIKIEAGLEVGTVLRFYANQTDTTPFDTYIVDGVTNLAVANGLEFLLNDGSNQLNSGKAEDGKVYVTKEDTANEKTESAKREFSYNRAPQEIASILTNLSYTVAVGTYTEWPSAVIRPNALDVELKDGGDGDGAVSIPVSTWSNPTLTELTNLEVAGGKVVVLGNFPSSGNPPTYTPSGTDYKITFENVGNGEEIEVKLEVMAINGNITAVENSFADVYVDYGTLSSDVINYLNSTYHTANITVSHSVGGTEQNTNITAGVTWSSDGTYNATPNINNLSTPYTFTGTLVPGNGITNTGNIKVSAKVYIEKPVVAEIAYTPTVIEVAKGTSQSAVTNLLPKTATVRYENETVIDNTRSFNIKTPWTCASGYNPDSLGDYVFTSTGLDNSNVELPGGLVPKVTVTVRNKFLTQAEDVNIQISKNDKVTNLTDLLSKSYFFPFSVLGTVEGSTDKIPVYFDFSDVSKVTTVGNIFNGQNVGTYEIHVPIDADRLPDGVGLVGGSAVKSIKVTIVVTDDGVPPAIDDTSMITVINHYEDNKDRIIITYVVDTVAQADMTVNVYNDESCVTAIASGVTDASGVLEIKKSTHSGFVLNRGGGILYIKVTDTSKGTNNVSARSTIPYSIQPVRATIAATYSMKTNAGSATIPVVFVPTLDEIANAVENGWIYDGFATPKMIFSLENNNSNVLSLSTLEGTEVIITAGSSIGSDILSTTYVEDTIDDSGIYTVNNAANSKTMKTTISVTSSGSGSGGGGGGGGGYSPPSPSPSSTPTGEKGANEVTVTDKDKDKDGYYVPSGDDITKAGDNVTGKDNTLIINVEGSTDGGLKVGLPIDETVDVIDNNEHIEYVQFKTDNYIVDIPTGGFKEDVLDVYGKGQYYQVVIEEGVKNQTLNKSVDGYFGEQKDIQYIYPAINGVKINKFANEEGVIIRMKYDPDKQEDASKIVAYKVDQNGAIEVLRNSIYDEKNKEIIFKVTVLGNYTMGQSQIKFEDLVDVDWAIQSINGLAARGIVEGMSDKLFEPRGNITREQFTKLLVLAFNIYDDTAVATFSDVKKGEWYVTHIASAEKAGIVTGYRPGEFGEEKPFGIGRLITREEMAVMVTRTCDKLGIKLSEAVVAVKFEDQEAIQSYAVESVVLLQKAGMVSGMPEGTYAPQDYTQRCQAAKIIYGLCEQQIKKELNLI